MYAVIDTFRTGYAPDQVRDTMTLGQLAEYFQELAEEYGEDTKVYTGHDRRYTYGGITWDSICIETEEDEEQFDF